MLFRRFMSLLCCLFLLLPLVSCEKVDGGTMTEASTARPAPEQPDEDPGRDYSNLERRKIGEVSDAFFGFDEDNRALCLAFPKVWTMAESPKNNFLILRDGMEIGCMKAGEEELPEDAEILEALDSTNGDLSISWELFYDPSGLSEEERYQNRFLFSYAENGTERTVTVRVGYTEMSDFAVRKFLYSSELKRRVSDPGFLTVGVKPENLRKPILILGNSFIGTSDIGDILQDMLNGSGRSSVTVQAVSVGYATVSQSWSSYLYAMRRGEYAAVFMCGFYGASDVTEFQRYVDACQVSGTPIVIFPAHNEGSGESAIKKYSNLPSLNWKDEINMLISSGVPRADFCINDQHQHSTPLAGYVGAHMIYRALFGEVPKAQLYYGYSLSHEYVEELLGDYVNSGNLTLLEDERVLFLG